jgi:transcriptional regulator GlxA family with amidase domain
MIFGFLLFPGLEELDLVGPWEMIRMWSRTAPGRGPDRRLLIAERLEPVRCAGGMSIVPEVTFGDCPQLDYLLVPGGEGTRSEVDNELLIGFIRKQAEQCRTILSVCTGAFILHRAGLLSGRSATTHWASLERLRALGDVTVVEQRFVQDGNIWTAAGVAAGIDLALALIEHIDGEQTAGTVQLAAEYYPSARLYGTFHRLPTAPEYAKKPA